MQVQARRLSRAGVMLVGLILTLLAVVPAAKADLYNPADWAPMVWSDKADYAPGELVSLSGAHWTPGETVNLVVNDDDDNTWRRDVNVTAADDGTISDQFNLPSWFVANYSVKATGTSSGTATWTFTDSRLITSASLNGGTSASVAPGASITASVAVTTDSGGGNQNWRSTGWRIATSAPGTVACANHANHDGSGSYSESFPITAPSAPGTYNAYLIAYSDDGCTSQASSTFRLAGAVTVKTNQTITFTALGDRTYGDADVPLTASASSGLPVSFETETPGTCSIVAGKVRLGNAGQCTVTASQAGNATYNAAPDAQRSFTIAKAPLSVEANDASRNYGDANPVFDGVITGIRNNDAISATYSSTATPASNVGSYAIVPQVVATAPVLANYDVVSTSGTLTVGKAPLSVRVDDKTKVYGDANPELTGELTGVKNEDHITASYSTTADETTGVGEYVIAAHADGGADVLANYEVELVEGTLTISKAPLSVKADDKTKVYGDGNPEFTGTLTGVRNEDAVTASYSTTADEKTGVGEYVIAADAEGEAAVLANYDVELLDGTLKVTKAPLSVKADDKTKVYGEGNPEFTGTLTGVRNEDALTASYLTTADETSGVGEYVIAPHADGDADVLANYQVERIDGTLKITKAPLSVNADDASRSYGEANAGFTGVITGIKNGDDVKAEYSSEAGPATGVGTYPIVARIVGADAVLANYMEPVLNAGTLTITKAQLSVKADDKTKVYGDGNPVLTGTLTGVKNGDAVTKSFSTDVDETTGVGAYVIVAHADGDADLLANYEVERINGTLTITKAQLSVKANDATRLLGGDNPVFTGTVTGRRNGDVVTVTYSTPATTASPVGSYPVVPEVVATAVLANYDVAVTNGTLTIVYRWDGFLQPINDTAHQTGAESKFKLGQTVPAKFVIKNASGAVVSQASNPTFSRSANLGPCDPNTVAESVTEDLTPGAGGNYSWDGSKYHYNWSTKGLTGGEYRIYASLADGTKRYVDICLTK